MSETTNIEWCDATFNPWIGCTKVSPGGCANCYAEVSTPARVKRAAGVETWGPHGQRQRTSAHNWKQPLAWNAAADAFEAEHGRRRRVFCASLADVFDNAAPMEWRDDLWRLIEATPRLDWLLLTKRIGNVNNMLPIPFDFAERYPHVWIGATVVNQEELDRDLPKLYATDAAVRFLSVEPMLGPISFDAWPLFGEDEKPLLHWVICGGESGHAARPMHPDWARILRDQCAAFGVPFLFKQWGEWSGPADPIPGCSLGDELRRGTVQHLHAPGNPHGFFRRGDAYVRRIGKKAAGRLLDGITHDEFPA